MAIFLSVFGSSLLPETSVAPDRKIVTIKQIVRAISRGRIDSTIPLAPSVYANTIANMVAQVLKVMSRILVYFSYVSSSDNFSTLELHI